MQRFKMHISIGFLLLDLVSLCSQFFGGKELVLYVDLFHRNCTSWWRDTKRFGSRSDGGTI